MAVIFVSHLNCQFISNIHHFSHFLSRRLLFNHCRAVKTLTAKFMIHLTHTRTQRERRQLEKTVAAAGDVEGSRLLQRD